jgi:rhodanese-related sulfurtransferase
MFFGSIGFIFCFFIALMEKNRYNMWVMRSVLYKYFFVPFVGSFIGIFLFAISASGGTKGITAKELKAMIDNGDDVTIIDVRTPEEYEGGHIPGSISLPVNTIKDLDTVPYDGRVVLYCTTGVRSERAGKMFAAKGVEDMMDLKGGITAWERFGGEVAAASANKGEEIEYFSGIPAGATVPKGVCEIDYAPVMKIGEE